MALFGIAFLGICLANGILAEVFNATHLDPRQLGSCSTPCSSSMQVTVSSSSSWWTIGITKKTDGLYVHYGKTFNGQAVWKNSDGKYLYLNKLKQRWEISDGTDKIYCFIKSGGTAKCCPDGHTGTGSWSYIAIDAKTWYTTSAISVKGSSKKLTACTCTTAMAAQSGAVQSGAVQSVSRCGSELKKAVPKLFQMCSAAAKNVVKKYVKDKYSTVLNKISSDFTDAFNVASTEAKAASKEVTLKACTSCATGVGKKLSGWHAESTHHAGCKEIRCFDRTCKSCCDMAARSAGPVLVGEALKAKSTELCQQMMSMATPSSPPPRRRSKPPPRRRSSPPPPTAVPRRRRSPTAVPRRRRSPTAVPRRRRSPTRRGINTTVVPPYRGSVAAAATSIFNSEHALWMTVLLFHRI